MIFASINGNSYTFDTWSEYHAATFSPDNRPDFVTDFTTRGKDYNSRKESARTIAQDFQHYEQGGLTWSEYNAITGKLEALGKRYGLLKEYRENGII